MLIMIDNSFPSNPDFVTVKLTTYTKASVWGGKCIAEFRVVRYSLKFSLKSTALSPIIITHLGP